MPSADRPKETGVSLVPVEHKRGLAIAGEPRSGRTSAQHASIGDLPHRDIGDERAAVGARHGNCEGVRAGQGRPTVGRGPAVEARSPSGRQRARSQRAVGPSSRGSRSESNARRPRGVPARGARPVEPRRCARGSDTRPRRCRPSARIPVGTRSGEARRGRRDPATCATTGSGRPRDRDGPGDPLPRSGRQASARRPRRSRSLEARCRRSLPRRRGAAAA